MREQIVFRFKNIEVAAQRLANELTSEIALLANTQDQVVIALCGGSSPHALYSALVDSIGTLHETTRSKLRFVPLDERCVEDSSPDHNLAQIDRLFFEPLARGGGLVSWQICWYQQQDDTNEDALARFRDSFVNIGNRIDVVIAGVGNDGHIASLFPNHLVTQDRQTVGYVLVKDSPKPPPQRISASRALINKAAITVGIFLEGKENAYRTFQTTSASIEQDCPAKLLYAYDSSEDGQKKTRPKLFVLTNIFDDE